MASSTRMLGVIGTGLLAAIAFTTGDLRGQVTIVRNLAAGAPPATTAGGGNLTDIFNAAADWWEATLVTPPYTLTLTYRWGPLGGGTLGSHSLQTQGGAPNRETAGSITFDNDGSSSWFLDSTPCDNGEYATGPTLSSANLGGGALNTGRTFTGATGNAVGNTDLFAVCLHEIGHSLGLSSANTSFIAESGDGDVDVTAPRPFPGSAIPLSAGSAHVDIGTALMFPSIGTGLRRLPTQADALANAQISSMSGIAPVISCPTGGGGSPLTTTFANNNGGASGGAVYFELECTDSAGLTIANLDLNVGGTGGVPASFNLYIQPLAAAGTCDPLGAWAGPVATGAAAITSPAGTPTNFVLSPPLALGLGCRICVAIAGDFAHAYTTGTAPFQLLYSTAHLELQAGQASNVPFTAPLFNPRVVNTNIYYVLGGSCPPMATCNPQGSGCVAQFTSFYELLTPTAMDLGGRRFIGDNTGTVAATRYVGTTLFGGLNAIGSLGPAAMVPLSDDQVLSAGTLGLFVGSNGIVYNGAGGTAAFVPAIATLLSQPVQGWYSWTDLNPAAVGSGRVWYEQAGTRAQITYDGVYGFGTTTPNSLQFLIDTSNGDYEIRWGVLSTTNPQNWLVGYSPAGASLDPGPVNISAATALQPIRTFPGDSPPLTLECIGRPVQGAAAINFGARTVNIPPTAVIHLGIIGLTRTGLPLGFLGFPPSCVQWATPDVISAALFVPPPAPGSFVWNALTIPAAPPIFTGFEFNLQSVTLELSGINQSTRVSNGLKCVIGAL